MNNSFPRSKLANVKPGGSGTLITLWVLPFLTNFENFLERVFKKSIRLCRSSFDRCFHEGMVVPGEPLVIASNKSWSVGIFPKGVLRNLI